MKTAKVELAQEHVYVPSYMRKYARIGVFLMVVLVLLGMFALAAEGVFQQAWHEFMTLKTIFLSHEGG